jgi:hypothetical protein
MIDYFLNSDSPACGIGRYPSLKKIVKHPRKAACPNKCGTAPTVWEDDMKSFITMFLIVLLVGFAVPCVNAQQLDPDKCKSYEKSDYGEKHHIGDLSDHWSAGSKATASLFSYNITTEKAAFNERTLGVGFSFRYYTDSQLANAGTSSIKDVPQACRARTADLLDFSRAKNGEEAKVGSLVSFSPTLFVSKTETEGDVSIQPAIVVGFFNDILSIGTAYHLTGTGKGQWSLLIGPSYGFQF